MGIRPFGLITWQPLLQRQWFVWSWSTGSGYLLGAMFAWPWSTGVPHQYPCPVPQSWSCITVNNIIAEGNRSPRSQIPSSGHWLLDEGMHQPLWPLQQLRWHSVPGVGFFFFYCTREQKWNLSPLQLNWLIRVGIILIHKWGNQGTVRLRPKQRIHVR